MDRKDKQLLYYLGENARLSYSQLSKLTGTSQETIRYRINNLVKEGVIEKFITIINTKKLGISFYQILLKLRSITETEKKSYTDSLKKEKRIAWIGNLEGNYNLGLIVAVKNQIELKESMDKITNIFNKKIIKKTISINIEGNFFPRDYLINKKRELIENSKYETEKEIEILDKTNLKILESIAEGGRISFVELSSKIKISADSMAKKYAKLKKEGIITGSSVILNLKKINQFQYKVLLFLNDFSPEKINQLKKEIKSNQRVISLIQTLADWDYEIDLEIENPDQLNTFMLEISTKFPGMVKDYEILRVLDMPKYNFIP